MYELPLGRHLAVDERGVGLRMTWRLNHGFINLSLWREDTCVETFHLRPADAAEVVAFLVRGLAEASSVGVVSHARAGNHQPAPSQRRAHESTRDLVVFVRSRLARGLAAAADRLSS